MRIILKVSLLIAIPLLIICSCNSVEKKGNTNENSILSKASQSQYITASTNLTANLHTYNQEHVIKLLFKNDEIIGHYDESNSFECWSENYSLYIDDFELIYLSENESIDETLKVYKNGLQSESSKDLLLKSKNDVINELEKILSDIGIEFNLTLSATLDYDSFEEIVSNSLSPNLNNDNELSSFEEPIKIDDLVESYYFEFDIYCGGFPLIEDRYYDAERYHLVLPSKIRAMVTDEGIQYLHIFGAMSVNSFKQEENMDFSSHSVEKYLVMRQNRLLSPYPIEILDISMKYAPIRVGVTGNRYMLKPVWSLIWIENGIEKNIIYDAELELEFV